MGSVLNLNVFRRCITGRLSQTRHDFPATGTLKNSNKAHLHCFIVPDGAIYSRCTGITLAESRSNAQAGKVAACIKQEGRSC
jgi:hypothetical protein